VCCSGNEGNRFKAAALVSSLIPPLIAIQLVLLAGRLGQTSGGVTPAPAVRLSPGASNSRNGLAPKWRRQLN
jgi:hypothetical protein